MMKKIEELVYGYFLEYITNNFYLMVILEIFQRQFQKQLLRFQA
jgi:hypothetical protein